MGKQNRAKRTGIGGPKQLNKQLNSTKKSQDKGKTPDKYQNPSSLDSVSSRLVDPSLQESQNAIEDPPAEYITSDKGDHEPRQRGKAIESDDYSLSSKQRDAFDINDVPMEYRAQVAGRCQRHRINYKVIGKLKVGHHGSREEAAAIHWIEEWKRFAAVRQPFTPDSLKLLPDHQPVQIQWRLISNSGDDAGFIRPVIAAGGWPMIPGSSIKGLFRRSCKEIAPSRVMAWCGGETANGETQPGLLRFHGAWPADGEWRDHLLDVVHPQQQWQVGMRQDAHNANSMASLYQPKLNIAVSSRDLSLSEEDWSGIRSVMRHALGMGIGGRTCAGYGRCGLSDREVLFECSIQGQGPASKLLDGTYEFRPNMFRAAIRGMALRLFGGVTDKQTALQAVAQIFGSIEPDEKKQDGVGMLASVFLPDSIIGTKPFPFRKKQYAYKVTGKLQWLLVKPPQDNDRDTLRQLLEVLHGLVMSFGGFGRSWRRPDHSIFFREYYSGISDRAFIPLIGCHWQWRDLSSLPSLLHVQAPEDLKKLLHESKAVAMRWLHISTPMIKGACEWREVIDSNHFFVWTREAVDFDDAVAIRWFHSDSQGNQTVTMPSNKISLKGTDLAGYVTPKLQIVGHLWNRLLPLGLDLSCSSSKAQVNPDPAVRLGAVLQRPVSGKSNASPNNAKWQSRKYASYARPQGSSVQDLHSGSFLEIVVLNVPDHRKQDFQGFIDKMDEGAGSNFARINW